MGRFIDVDLRCLLFVCQVSRHKDFSVFRTPKLLDSIFIYLEYGLAWPFNGGEFIYVSIFLFSNLSITNW